MSSKVEIVRNVNHISQSQRSEIDLNSQSQTQKKQPQATFAIRFSYSLCFIFNRHGESRFVSFTSGMPNESNDHERTIWI
ncbi:hypothetical protein QVD17_35986 [Tagetes erecta]|uniref:Uncharacterized protein n=1 Tax=Tagetes erecta TaxID=13708 RepID=A0AAD8JRH6_TARER|nr:hypothetical protein QVD17_35986 [Tagetes erecta]